MELGARLSVKTRTNMLEIFKMLGDYSLPERSHTLEPVTSDESSEKALRTNSTIEKVSCDENE